MRQVCQGAKSAENFSKNSMPLLGILGCFAFLAQVRVWISEDACQFVRLVALPNWIVADAQNRYFIRLPGVIMRLAIIALFACGLFTFTLRGDAPPNPSGVAALFGGRIEYLPPADWTVVKSNLAGDMAA